MSATLEDVVAFPFKTVETSFATYYASWSLSKTLSFVGAILRVIFVLVYWVLTSMLFMLNFILNLFGVRRDLLTMHTLVRHFLTGEAVVTGLKDDSYRTEFEILRKCITYTYPLFWYF